MWIASAFQRPNPIKLWSSEIRYQQLHYWSTLQELQGDRGSTVVKVLYYKSEGRWFDPSWCHWILHWHKILPIALKRPVRKADNLPPSCAVVTKSGNLNFLEPSGPFRACKGTALPFYRNYKHRNENKNKIETISCIARLCFFLQEHRSLICCNVLEAARH